MPERRSLSHRLADALRAAATRPNHEDDTDGYEQLAETSRDFLSARVREYAAALERACIRQRHRGSAEASSIRSGAACPRCRAKIRHVLEAADLIAPEGD